MNDINSVAKLNVNTSNLQSLPSDADETENAFDQMLGQIGNALDFSKIDMESPLTELKRAFDMLQTSSFFAETSSNNIEDEELPPTNDYTQLGPCLESLNLTENTLTTTQRSSRLQTRRPASLCIHDSAKEAHVIIRTPSVPPTTLTFPSSTGSPTGMEANSAFLPFYLDPRDTSVKRSASNGLRIYSTDSAGKERNIQWASPHVHFSDWSNGNDERFNNGILINEDEIRSSPAFDNPFCFEDSYAASSCYDDTISRRSSTMQLASSVQSTTSSSISLESSADILTAPPILGREWHRGQRYSPDKREPSSYLDVKSQKPQLSRLTPHINAANSNSKRSTINRGGMRSASATATSTFRNAIRTIKRTTSFYDHGKSAKRKDSKESGHGDFMEDDAIYNDDKSAQSTKIYGFALNPSHQKSAHTTKKEGNRKHPNKSPYPPNVARMPSPSPSSPSVSFHFQSPMMASYFATLG